MLSDNKKKEFPSKAWKKVIFKSAFTAGLSVLITFFQVFVGNSFS
jgi:hypothetical protein